MASPRIYLTGRVALECSPHVVDERELSGRQGRLAFVFLTVRRSRPVDRETLVRALWIDHPPAEVDAALSAILSKLRGVFRKVGLGTREAGIDVRHGTIALRLPADAWIDLEEVGNAVDLAEGALRAGDHARAWSLANVVVSIARRPLLSGEESPWIHECRKTLKARLLRGLSCLSAVSCANGEAALAVEYAEEAVALEPFQETAYQQLMRTQARIGNRAEAVFLEILRGE